MLDLFQIHITNLPSVQYFCEKCSSETDLLCTSLLDNLNGKTAESKSLSRQRKSLCRDKQYEEGERCLRFVCKYGRHSSVARDRGNEVEH